MSSILPTLGTISLLHALYSSYEFTHLSKSSGTHTQLPFPKDIQLEVLLAVLMFFAHIFMFSGHTKEWSLVDNGRLLKKGKLEPVLMKDGVAWAELKGAHPTFKQIETRVTFMDIRKKREEFKEWQLSDEAEATNEKK